MLIHLRRFFNSCLDVLFPPPGRCLLCGRAMRDQQGICPACLTEISHSPGPHCLRCGRPLAAADHDHPLESRGCLLCAGKEWAFSQARSIGPYAGSLRLAVHRLKFRGQQQFGRALGGLLYRSVEPAWWAEVDGVVPVPLHPERLQQRGFNQAEVIAQQLSFHLGKPVRRLLLRTVATSPQTGLSQRQRQQNVYRAFSFTPGIERQARGNCLLLVDDVLTTGSTLDACTRALLRAGAREVRVATLAITNLQPRD